MTADQSTHEFRWLNPAALPDAQPHELAWQPVVPREGQSVEYKVRELEAQTFEGRPCVEVRPVQSTAEGDVVDLIEAVVDAANEMAWAHGDHRAGCYQGEAEGIRTCDISNAKRTAFHAAVDALRTALASRPNVQPKHTACEFTNELGNAIRITIEGPTSTSENVLTPMEAAKLRSALNEHAAPSPTPAPEVPALPAVAEARGFVAFGAGVYRVCQTVEPGLVVTFRRPGEEDRAVGERNAAPDLTPIPPEEIIVRLEFRNVSGLDSLEDHLREIRQQHWPESVPNLLVDAMAHANANAWAVTKEWARGWNDARLAIAKAHLAPSPAVAHGLPTTEDRTRALNLAYQFRSHPASRGIDDIEQAGELILSLLSAQAPFADIREVVRISDRSHPAWDKVKAWLQTIGDE